jgi:hypothetical protein
MDRRQRLALFLYSFWCCTCISSLSLTVPTIGCKEWRWLLCVSCISLDYSSRYISSERETARVCLTDCYRIQVQPPGSEVGLVFDTWLQGSSTIVLVSIVCIPLLRKVFSFPIFHSNVNNLMYHSNFVVGQVVVSVYTTAEARWQAIAR